MNLLLQKRIQQTHTNKSPELELMLFEEKFI